MYKTIVRFVDLQDHNHVYNVGDVFPHDGKVISSKRLEELSTANNRRKMAVIEEIKEEPKKAEEHVEEVQVEQEEVAEQPKPTQKRTAKTSTKKVKK